LLRGAKIGDPLGNLHQAIMMALKRMRRVGLALAVLVVVFGGLGSTCEQQDFRQLDEVLVVSASQGIAETSLVEPYYHPIITRHEVDYRVSNTSEQGEAVEVVVHAESLVNGIVRAAGWAVLQLDAGAVAEGRISDLELQLGNSVDLSLQCCGASRCLPRKVLCPGSATTPAVCVEGCGRLEGCTQDCVDAVDSTCLDCTDSECRTSCCTDQCASAAAACVGTCLAMYERCGQTTPKNDAVLIPCSMCTATTGLCSWTWSVENQAVMLVDSNLVETRCEPDCRSYPAACTSECDTSDPTEGFFCARNCVLAYQRACGLDPTSPSTNVEMPCCFGQVCEASMEAVFKFEAVECFQHTVCGSGRVCNDRGICENKVRLDQTSCDLAPRARTVTSPLWLLALGFLLALSRHAGQRRPRARRGFPIVTFCATACLLTATLVGTAHAEPRGFRRTRSTFSAGVSAFELVGGSLGQSTGTGVGLTAQETLQSGYWGVAVRLGSTIVPTHDTSMPFDHGVQLFSFAIAPRFFIPTSDAINLFVFIQPEYQLLGFQSNTLVELTGNQQYLQAPGLTTGALLNWGGAALEFDINANWLWMTDGFIFNFSLSSGFVGFL